MTTPVLLFIVCGQRYALAIDEVIEVAAMMTVDALPAGHNPALRGVVVRQGAPLLLADLRQLLGCSAAPIDLETLFIVAQSKDERAGFIVDQIQGVVYLDESLLRSVPGGSSFSNGVLTFNETLVHWLAAGPLMAATLQEPHNET
ncbi:MAG: chemotaxis protein CheW [Chloroflexota bacterium]